MKTGDEVGNGVGPRRGFTLVETMLVVAIIGTLAALAMPLMARYLHRTKIVRTIRDLRVFEADLAMYSLRTGSLPPSLAEIDRGDARDPWGGPYIYLPYAGNPQSLFRKERFLVPLNAEYDLYSRGPDGESETELSAPLSLDDVVRANDGAFIGVAAEF